MAEGQATIRTRKVMRNALLSRRQMIIDVIHPGRAVPSKEDIRAELSKMFKADIQNIAVFNFRTGYGGGKSTGFGLVYDNLEALKKFEPRHRLIRAGLAEPRQRKRKQFKDLKKKRRTTWGTGRKATARKAKRAGA